MEILLGLAQPDQMIERLERHSSLCQGEQVVSHEHFCIEPVCVCEVSTHHHTLEIGSYSL